MALLLPNLRQVLKYGAGIKDRATQTAVQALESWSDDLVRRLSRLEESTGGGVPATRTISTTSPLSGGGDLSANRTLTVAANSISAAGTVATAPNDTTKFYRGDATWATPPGNWAVVGSTTLGAAASTISVSGLDGDADVNYEVELNYLATSTAAHNLDIRPNGDTAANRNTTRVLDGGTPATSSAGIFTSNGAVANALSARYVFRCFVARDATITYYRRFLADGTLAWNLGVGNGHYEAVTVYSSNTANLTSLEVGISTAQFAIGSQMIVRKKT